jgi:hypothetical protein
VPRPVRHLSSATCASCASDEFEFRDDAGVSLGILTLQILQQAAALRHHLDQTTARTDVLAMRFQVFGELFDLLCKKGDLHLGGASVLIVNTELLNDLIFL